MEFVRRLPLATMKIKELMNTKKLISCTAVTLYYACYHGFFILYLHFSR